MKSVGTTNGARDSDLRDYLHKELDAHMASLGYKTLRELSGAVAKPEIVRRNAVRGRVAYGETVLSSDLKKSNCHRRLVDFARRKTRRRSSILFFIGVNETDSDRVESLLGELGIVSKKKGGHVHVVPIPLPE